MRKCLVVLLTLPALALWLRAADPTADPARAAFERGNALLRGARQTTFPKESDLLREAAREYRDCLASSTSTPELLAAARYNLELTNLLSAQVGHAGKANGSGDKQAGPREAAKPKGEDKGGPGESPTSPGKKDGAAKSDAANPKDEARAKAEGAKTKDGSESKTAEAAKTKDGAQPNDEASKEGANDAAQAGADPLAELMQEPEPLVYDSQCPT
jgi:hypothetical protein